MPLPQKLTFWNVAYCLQNSTTLMDLAVALTAQILQHVPLAARLNVCALVCSTLAAAAMQATVHVHHELRTDAVAAFQDWLQQHAWQLLSLRLQSGAPSNVQLHPLRLPLHKLMQLQQLELDSFEVHLTAQESSSSGSAAPPAALEGGFRRL